jgi:hypothetical protein
MQHIDQRMKAFIAYVSQYDPVFVSEIEAASPEEIATYEKRARYPVPEIFRSYLACMGRRNGKIEFNWDGWYDIRQLISYYDDGISENEDIAPDNCIVIGRGGLSDDVGLLVGGKDEGQVVFINDMTRVAGFCAETFEKLLYKCAFTRYRLRAFPHHAYYNSSYQSVGGEFIVPQASAEAEQSGFGKQWFSDKILFCGEREGLAIAFGQKEGDGAFLTVSGNNMQEVEKAGEIFTRKFGIKRQEGSKK